jgi:IS4 transposase
LNQGRTVFAQLISFVSHNDFNRCVARYGGNKSVRSFSCWDQFLTMAFAQLTYRESLRDIEVCLAAQRQKLYHAGFSGPVKRATLADANEKRDWRIYRDFAESLIQIARPLYAHSDLGLELEGTAYAFDATTIDLCLSLFPWAQFRRRKAAIKLHTLLEIHSAIPVFIAITSGAIHEVNLLDELHPEPGSFIVMDRGFVDFQRLYRLHTALAFFVIRTKDNLAFRRRYSHPHDRATGVRSDQTIILTGPKSATLYPIALRRVHYYSVEREQRLVLLTNNFSIPALTVAALYRYRWQIELFFKWIKQHLRIKSFFGTSDNSVKTQIWIAVTVYVLVALVKKRLGLKQDLYTLLQIFSLTLFEKTPILGLLQQSQFNLEMLDDLKQLQLLDI